MRMGESILLYASVDAINQIMKWGIGLVAITLTLRASHDFMLALDEPETGIKEAFRKVKKRIKAAVIAITIESTVIFIQHFY